MKGDLSDDVKYVWDGYEDFREGGLDYVGFVQRRNIQEMEQAETEDEVANELADQVICALRQLYEMGYYPEGVVQDRLQHRMDGQQEQIIHNYQNEYALKGMLGDQ